MSTTVSTVCSASAVTPALPPVRSRCDRCQYARTRLSAPSTPINDRFTLGVEAERGVRSAYGVVDLLCRYDHGDPDLRGRDHADVDAGVRQGCEERRRDARVGAHADPDDRDLADLVVVQQIGEPDRALHRAQRLHRDLAVGLRQRERDRRRRLLDRDVLHDHVDVDVYGRDGLEDAGGLADLVGNTDDGDFRLAAIAVSYTHLRAHETDSY